MSAIDECLPIQGNQLTCSRGTGGCGVQHSRAMSDHKAIREALASGSVQYACHVDGEVSQSCAFDAGQYLRDCRIAVRLNAKGQCKTDCEQWKPLNLNTSTVQVSAGDLRALLADLDAVRGALRVMPLLIECVKHQQWETALAFADQLDTSLKGASHD